MGITHGDVSRLWQVENSGLVPSFFIGLISMSKDDFPVGDKLPEGQFIYQHQYHGHSCQQAYLRGIFAPIQTLPTSPAKTLLMDMPAHYGLDAETGPTALTKVSDTFASLGLPRPRERESREGLFRFDPEPLLYWLSANAGHVQELSGDKVSKTAGLPWQSIDEYSRWLSGYGKLPLLSTDWKYPACIQKQAISDDVVGALLYPNGD